MAAKTLKDKKYAAKNKRKSGCGGPGQSPRNGPHSQGSRYGGGRGNGGRWNFPNRMGSSFQPYPSYPPRQQGFQTRPPFQAHGNAGRSFSGRNGNRFNGRDYRPPQGRGNYNNYNNGGQQHYAESHYQEADSFVPEGTVPDGNQGRLPSAEAGARQDQHFQQQHYYINPYDQIEQDVSDTAEHYHYYTDQYGMNGDEHQQEYPADY